MSRREPWWIDGLYLDDHEYYRFNGEMNADTLSTAVFNIGRNNGPALLFDLFFGGVIDIGKHPGVVADVWSSAEYPANNLDPDIWVELFSEAGYTHDGQPATRPTQPVMLYRGCVPDRRFGMSWTTDVATAHRFAGSLLGRLPGHVYAHRAEPVELLAYLHREVGRGEAEYVIDPLFLDDGNVEILPKAA